MPKRLCSLKKKGGGGGVVTTKLVADEWLNPNTSKNWTLESGKKYVVTTALSYTDNTNFRQGIYYVENGLITFSAKTAHVGADVTVSNNILTIRNTTGGFNVYVHITEVYDFKSSAGNEYDYFTGNITISTPVTITLTKKPKFVISDIDLPSPNSPVGGTYIYNENTSTLDFLFGSYNNVTISGLNITMVSAWGTSYPYKLLVVY